ncbi:AmmeMemoRadiSam system protein A [Halorhodospira neutriphila]|uniref:AMMECR1 domain-containing protein n=1 Tax=Halorhodospira neutriphila TaxID=168379 RepID=A0ABS1E772_9GAMM|nr:AmmeMemoRadiSam system protein A [Halorhodospira neutriphila]MBK1727037.1 hypothetical protein [Halorhodospira neutriphila]
MSSTEPSANAQQQASQLGIPGEHGRLLARLARQAIAHRLETGEAPPVPRNLPEPLQQTRAAFASLHHGEQLRGCMGTLIGRKPLIEQAQESAVEAALADPRFEPVSRAELDRLTLSASVLTDPEQLWVDSEAELLERLRPGEDGLILKDGHRQATFLPAVWAHLPEPQAFIAHLKAKAGLRPDHWSPDMQVARYTSVTFTAEPPLQGAD